MYFLHKIRTYISLTVWLFTVCFIYWNWIPAQAPSKEPFLCPLNADTVSCRNLMLLRIGHLHFIFNKQAIIIARNFFLNAKKNICQAARTTNKLPVAWLENNILISRSVANSVPSLASSCTHIHQAKLSPQTIITCTGAKHHYWAKDHY